MSARIANYLSTLPAFAMYFAASVALLVAFLFAYTQFTPHRERDLIRAGNTAAAMAVSGAALGFVLPLASVIIHSHSLIDMVLWGVVALVVQIATFLAIRAILPGLADRIAAGQAASGATVGAFSVCVGILNAACMST
jgi:putative membrane protein